MLSRVIVENVTKTYDKRQVLKGVSLNVDQGEIYALLGLNGAGKTTLLEIIEDLRKCDSGTVKINGTLGVQLQNMVLPATMKVKEAIELFCSWKKVDSSIGKFHPLILPEYLNTQYYKLSQGWKSRLHIALAVCGNPDVIILDEPTAGLDIEGRKYFHDLILAKKAEGKSIIYSTHEIAEAQNICDRIGVLNEGVIAIEGSPSSLVTSTTQSFEDVIMALKGGKK